MSSPASALAHDSAQRVSAPKPPAAPCAVAETIVLRTLPQTLR